MEHAFDEQNKLMDEIINKMYEYDLYGRFKSEKYINGNVSDIVSDISNTLSENIKFQHSMLDMFEIQGEDISNTFQHTEDMNERQQEVYQNITNQQEVVKKRHDKLSNANQMNQRQYEIYSYYYYKYRVQLKLLYVFLAYIVILILFTIIHKYYPYDKIYSILVGVLSACLLIYICTQLYDIYLRSGHVFDEYEKTWNYDNNE